MFLSRLYAITLRWWCRLSRSVASVARLCVSVTTIYYLLPVTVCISVICWITLCFLASRRSCFIASWLLTSIWGCVFGAVSKNTNKERFSPGCFCLCSLVCMSSETLLWKRSISLFAWCYAWLWTNCMSALCVEVPFLCWYPGSFFAIRSLKAQEIARIACALPVAFVLVLNFVLALHSLFTSTVSARFCFALRFGRGSDRFFPIAQSDWTTQYVRVFWFLAVLFPYKS